ncbi:MAG: FecR domain-containing protein [Chitinophaga sp.]|uniref:FecR family protein n=1 Tax=Chitinophaga sp. TaxID=1869181 RepID=UPI001B2A7A2E|nr:FecR family protein [Chitinophaga sp.]MBO9731958.1 FecR domain-containing protein [Chitinophaga sp.]
MATDQNSETNPILQRIAYLVSRYHRDLLTAVEEEELRTWITASADNQRLFEQLTDPDILRSKLSQYEKFDMTAAWATFSAQHFPAAKVVRASRTYWWWSAAAAVLLLLGSTIYWYRQAAPATTGPAIPVARIMPGSTKATLTLADGTVVPLDSNGQQVITQQGALINLQNGQLQYHTQDYSAQASLNTLTTPRGGQFRLTLPDGTQVWLNAASAITYPTVFSEGKREVTIKGEVYFEVAAKAKMPFVVKAGRDASIEVLGTSFNVNAYTDEPGVQTTLVQGAVKVNAGNVSRVLSPGQQALITGPDQLNLVAKADTAAILAWKKNEFYFHDADIPTIMRQLSRWYDVSIVYAGNIPVRRFQGEIQRNLPLSDVLEGLENTGIHFRVQGRSIIVEP